ncbi:MAG: hypothetical protein ABJ215_17310, partial [Alphaproteobacteria bacterium]
VNEELVATTAHRGDILIDEADVESELASEGDTHRILGSDLTCMRRQGQNCNACERAAPKKNFLKHRSITSKAVQAWL